MGYFQNNGNKRTYYDFVNEVWRQDLSLWVPTSEAIEEEEPPDPDPVTQARLEIDWIRGEDCVKGFDGKDELRDLVWFSGANKDPNDVNNTAQDGILAENILNLLKPVFIPAKADLPDGWSWVDERWYSDGYEPTPDVNGGFDENLGAFLNPRQDNTTMAQIDADPSLIRPDCLFAWGKVNETIIYGNYNVAGNTNVTLPNEFWEDVVVKCNVEKLNGFNADGTPNGVGVLPATVLPMHFEAFLQDPDGNKVKYEADLTMGYKPGAGDKFTDPAFAGGGSISNASADITVFREGSDSGNDVIKNVFQPIDDADGFPDPSLYDYTIEQPETVVYPSVNNATAETWKFNVGLTKFVNTITGLEQQLAPLWQIDTETVSLSGIGQAILPDPDTGFFEGGWLNGELETTVTWTGIARNTCGESFMAVQELTFRRVAGLPVDPFPLTEQTTLRSSWIIPVDSFSIDSVTGQYHQGIIRAQNVANGDQFETFTFGGVPGGPLQHVADSFKIETWWSDTEPVGTEKQVTLSMLKLGNDNPTFQFGNQAVNLDQSLPDGPQDVTITISRPDIRAKQEVPINIKPFNLASKEFTWYSCTVWVPVGSSPRTRAPGPLQTSVASASIDAGTLGNLSSYTNTLQWLNATPQSQGGKRQEFEADWAYTNPVWQDMRIAMQLQGKSYDDINFNLPSITMDCNGIFGRKKQTSSETDGVISYSNSGWIRTGNTLTFNSGGQCKMFNTLAGDFDVGKQTSLERRIVLHGADTNKNWNLLKLYGID